MLDIHPPEHTPHSWRDFLIHIATIVVGLLIAIGLEQTVEYFHHRHQVTETRERILEELAIDRTNINVNVERLHKDDQLWTKYGIALTLPNVNAATVESFQYDWMLVIEPSSAWQVARQNDVFSHFPAEETTKYQYFYSLLAENYGTSVQYIADVRSADAIVRRIQTIHMLSSDDRLRLLALTDSLRARARNMLDLYSYLDRNLGAWLNAHPPKQSVET